MREVAPAGRSARGGLPTEVWQGHANDLEVAFVDAGAAYATADATDSTDSASTAHATDSAASTHTASSRDAAGSARSSTAARTRGRARTRGASGSPGGAGAPAAATRRRWRNKAIRTGAHQRDQSNETDDAKHNHLPKGYHGDSHPLQNNLDSSRL